LVVPFVGRSEQLAQFVGGVTEDQQSAVRIVNVSGSAGAGRSRFVEEALSKVSRLGRPNFVLQPALRPGLTGATFFRALGARLPIGNLVCSAAATRLEQGAGKVELDETAARSLVNALFQETYDCGLERRGFVRPKAQRLAFVLDDFDILPPSLIAWIAQQVLPLLHEIRAHLDYVLVLVTERSIAGDFDPIAWSAQAARFMAVELPPLTEKESVELLALFARRAAEARMCHEIAEGLPGPMLELLRHNIRPLAETATALERCTGATADLLVAVAALGLATEEGLRLALGPDALATASVAVQHAPIPVFGSLRSGGLWFPGALTRTVLDKLGPRLSDTLQRSREAAELLDQLEDPFPSEAERRTAVRMRVFRYFNRDALVACFGSKEGAELDQFTRTHPAGFSPTPSGNLRWTDGVAPLLDRYSRAIGVSVGGELQEKAVKYWSERSQEMKRQVTGATEHVASLEKERDELLNELQKARSRMTQCETDNQRNFKSRIDDDIVRLGVSLLANGAGVVCFWVALFSAGQRLSFIVLGGLLIGVGFGTPALSRRPTRAVLVARNNAAQQQKANQARGMVNLIEAQASSLQQRLAEERRRMEKFRSALEEPLVDCS
jgi:hypothetical protein